MLEHFFGSKTRWKLLQIFFRHPEKAFYVRELTRLAETQLNAVRREIANLERLGILKPIAIEDVPEQAGGTERSKFYALETASLLHPELQALLVKAQLLEEQELINALKERGGKLTLLLLTGFFTHDATVATDMVVVGQLKPVVINKLIRSFEKECGRTVRYTLLSDREFKDRREIGDRFLYSLFEAKHVAIVNEYNIS